MLNIAWTARDGFLDLFPSLASLLKDRIEINSHYLCHHPLEEEHLKSKYNLSNIWVISKYLKKNWYTIDCSSENIKKLQNKYNTIPLIRCLWSDKFQLKLPEYFMTRNLVGHFDFWEEFLLKNKIDILMSERPSILNTCVAWLVCKRFDIRFMCFISIPVLHERISMSTSWEGYIDGLEASLKIENIDEKSENYKRAIDYVGKMQIQPEKTAEAQLTIEISKKRTGLPLMEIKKLIFKPGWVIKRNRLRREYYIKSSIWKWLIDWLKTFFNFRLYSIFRVFKDDDRSLIENYFLFPLHRFVEWSNYSFMGPAFADQGNIVELISSCLPLGHYLYVKEHTGGFGEKSLRFYRKIKTLQNVKLINPYADTFELIRGCQGVVTLGSSMGFEAIMMGKPAIILGNPWYKGLPGIYKADSPEVLSELLQNIDKLDVPSEDKKIRTVYSLFNVSFNGVGASKPKTLEPQNIERLIQGLHRKIKEEFV